MLDKFVLLNQEDTTDLNILANECIFSNTLCQYSIIGWDVFAEKHEACSVHDRLMSSSKPSDDIYSDDSSVNPSVAPKLPGDPKTAPSLKDDDNLISKINVDIQSEGNVDGSLTTHLSDAAEEIPEGKVIEGLNYCLQSPGLCALSAAREDSLLVEEPIPTDASPKTEAKQKIDLTAASKVARFKNILYDKPKIKSEHKKINKVQDTVSQPMMTLNRMENYVIVMCLFDKASFLLRLGDSL